MRYTEKQGSVTHSKEKKSGNINYLLENQILDLPDQDFKADYKYAQFIKDYRNLMTIFYLRKYQ